MAGHGVVGWFLVKENRQNGAQSIEISGDVGENDCGARCCSCCHIGIAVRGIGIETMTHPFETN